MHYSDLDFLKIKKQLNEGKIFSCEIISGSMDPIIKIGESVKIQKTNNLKVFDIIVFYTKDHRLICHVFLGGSKLNKGHIKSSGLMADHFDFSVDQKRILGKVINKKLNIFNKLRILFRLAMR